MTAGTFFGFGWSAPEEAHAAAGDTVEASSIQADDIIYYGNYPKTDLGKVGTASVPAGTQGVDYVIQSTDTRQVQATRNGDHYFKIEPIAWRVLENDEEQLFLLSDKAIDNKPYNVDSVSMTWEKSTTRSWLNGYEASENTYGTDYSAAGTNFIGNAFSAAEQAKIASTDVDNPANPSYSSIPGGNDTEDKIFYLKVQDVSGDTAYFADNSSRKAAPTDYAVALGAFVTSGITPWWLRSPGSADSNAANVSYEGALFNYYVVNYANCAVRPAFYLENLSDLDLIETSAGDYLAVVPSENAYLKSLGQYTATLTPSYSPEITEYSVEVPYSAESVDFDAETYNESAEVTGDGEQEFTVDEQEFEITVTAEDESTEKTYTVTVTRGDPNTDATLSDLTVSVGTLDPGFDSGTEEYTVSVPYATDSITLTAETTDENATVDGDGEQDLDVGANPFEITVTAEDGSTEKTYTVTVTRAAASTDAILSDLSVSAGELDPGFASGTTEYTVSVPYATDSITLTAETTDANATVDGDGEQDLDVGENPFEITVTAEDETTEKTYTVTVTRAEAPPLSADANLKSLSVSGAALTPAFNANTINYSANVPNAIAQVTIAATTSDANAAVTGAGAKPLNVGANVFKIAVTAQSGSVKTYTVTVTRAASIPVVKPVYPKVTSIKTPMTKMSIVVKKGKLNLKNLVGLYTTGNKPIKDSKLTWTSSKPKVATVSKTGAVKAGKKTGKTTITVKAQNGKKLTITISVVKKAANLKKLTGTVPKLKKGKPAFITLKGTGTNITGVKWKVKGKGLKIDKFGMATATKTGKFTITATAGGKKFTKKITVK